MMPHHSLAISLALLAVLSLTVACGGYHAVTQAEEGTYLQLVGSTDAVMMSLDQQAATPLDKMTAFNLNGKRVTKIVIAPGQHRVTLTRGGMTLVDRQIYVSEGNAFEIIIP